MVVNRDAILHNQNRPFVAWDGEGINTKGPGKPQAYVLFGSSHGTPITRTDGETLSFEACANHILEIGAAHPDAWHVGFAFDYDVNQIVRTLPVRYLQLLHKNGSVKFGDYRIGWRSGKSFTVSRRTNTGWSSVTIYDVFSFWACSFVKALDQIFGSDGTHAQTIARIREGKSRRQVFDLADLQSEVLPYWQDEVRMLVLLTSQFRDLLYSAGFFISAWYGPGALASYVMRNEGIQRHKSVVHPEVSTASQHAYAGGRFELFRVGRYEGKIWGIDINSAYPDALSQLPSLKNGEWHYERINKSFSELGTEDIQSFSMYHVELAHPEWKFPLTSRVPPSPLFHRTTSGEMVFPWITEGWYWGPEVENLTGLESAYCFGAWHFIPSDPHVMPFAFIRDMYHQRSQWKREGRPEQLALKLAMNSIYGKLAQRVGWEQKGTAPTWHQLEWAGWVTSYVRSKLFKALWALGERIISVETDGIFTYRDPSDIGVSNSSELGGWSVSEYNEIIYLQSGTYFIRGKDGWSSKYRGLDPESLTLDDARRYFEGLEYKKQWPDLKGTTTRFIGLGAALNLSSGIPQKFRHLHGAWRQNADRLISPGSNGKRVHFSPTCVQCNQNISPMELPHWQGVGMNMDPNSPKMSTKHYLPWLNPKEFEKLAWRKKEQYEQGRLFDV